MAFATSTCLGNQQAEERSGSEVSLQTYGIIFWVVDACNGDWQGVLFFRSGGPSLAR